MFQNSCCSFCEQLPTIARPGRGSASKCPLCKQDLWVSPDGVTQRLVDARDRAAPRPAPRFLLAGLGVGLLALVCAGAALTRLTWGTPESAPVPAPVHVVVQALPQIAAAPADVKAPELPPVQIKRALPANAARVKPAKSMEPLAKASVKSIDYTYLDAPARVKSVSVVVPTAWKWTYVRPLPNAHEALLRDVPEVDLDPKYAAKAKFQVAAAAMAIAKENADAPDAFVKKLVKERSDLAGLPFLMGKECKLPADAAESLASGSLEVRRGLAEAARLGGSKSFRSESKAADRADAADLLVVKGYLRGGVPALHQILSAEKSEYRRLMATQFRNSKDPRATQSLIKLALFDVDAEVRIEALNSLDRRPSEEYRDQIMKAFRHPWAPIAHNAARAVVYLDMKDAVPDLVALFSQPEPTAPFAFKSDDGKEKMMVRELVRINHHRNCMLCHPPIAEAALADPKAAREFREIPVGPVTSMQDELPPSSSTVYYAPRPGITLVRADITYLRQDFSVVQAVKDPGNWPALQRFDFFVRTRELSDIECLVYKKRGATPEITPHTQAVLDALEGLTGKVWPPDAGAWQQEVLAARERKSMFKSKASP